MFWSNYKLFRINHWKLMPIYLWASGALSTTISHDASWEDFRYNR